MKELNTLSGSRSIRDMEELRAKEEKLKKLMREAMMAKEVKEQEVKCLAVQFGHAVQAGNTVLSSINSEHQAHKSKLTTDIIYDGQGIRFDFGGAKMFVPNANIAHIKLV